MSIRLSSAVPGLITYLYPLEETEKEKYFMYKCILLLATTLILFSCGGSGSKFVVTGSVLDSEGVGIPDVTVTMGGFKTTTDISGKYSFSDISEGSYTITPSLQGAVFSPNSITLYIALDTSTGTSFSVFWRPAKSASSSNLLGISYLNNTYFATGAAGTILLSQDGRTWSTGSTGTSNTINDLYGVAFGNGKYVAVGAGGTVLVSTDGLTWSVLSSITNADIFDILFDSTIGTFVAVGTGGSVLVSSDGLTWTVVTQIITAAINKIASFNGTLYAVGSGGAIITSNDGMTWTMLTSGTTSDLYGIFFGNNSYIAVGSGGTVLTSANGTAWFSMSIGVSNMLTGVAFGGTNFVATGTGFGNVFISPDGSTWTPKITDGSTNPPRMNRIIYGNGAFVAVGDNGTIYWTSMP